MTDNYDPLPGPVIQAADPQLCKNAINVIAARLMGWQKRVALMEKRARHAPSADRKRECLLMGNVWEMAFAEIEHLICLELGLKHGRDGCMDCWGDNE